MKINNIKIWVLSAGLMFSASNCTNDFEEINQQNNGSPENFLADYTAIVNPLQTLQRNFQANYQIRYNLNADMYSGMFSTATPFAGGKNNLTYNMIDGWNSTIMSEQQSMFNASIIIDNAAKNYYPGVDFTATLAVKKILKIFVASRVSDSHGPVVYSKYEKPNSNGTTDFDSQQDA